jgi:hypothetical protein
LSFKLLPGANNKLGYRLIIKLDVLQKSCKNFLTGKLMKPITRILSGILIISAANLLPAQDASTNDWQTMLQAVEQTTPQPAENAPDAGNFYSTRDLASASDLNDFPPRPADTINAPFWDLGGGFYLLDDLQVENPTLSRSGAHAMAESDPTDPNDPGDGSDTNEYVPNYIANYVPTTNDLWLQIISYTNQIASLVIHPPWNNPNGVWGLHFSTNVALPFTNWTWLLNNAPGQTNMLATNLPTQQGFFRLGPVNDLVGNSSLGTNFWMMFCNIFEQNEISLCFYISSPVGATGTVTSPEVLGNGPTVIVTNCGDGSVNGTYVLTNLTAQEQMDWKNNYPLNPDNPSYVKGTNWLNYTTGGYWYLVSYDSSTGDIETLYFMEGLDLTATADEWQQGDDSHYPNPATFCAQVPVNQPFTVAAGAVTNISIPLAAMMTDYDMVESNGIQVAASQPVSVYGMYYQYGGSAAFTVYPTTLLGTNYCVMAHAMLTPPPYNSGFYSQFAIVATTNNTMVSITPSPGANLNGHTGYYTTNLMQGQTYQINSLNNSQYAYLTNDVTGTRITSNQPIGVFAGVNAGRVPYANIQFSNPLIQEQVPVDQWGTNVVALSFAGRTGGDLYRILAAYSNTLVTITATNVTIITNLAAGTFCETNLDGPVQFQANQPIQVAQFANGTDFDGEEGDPCEILLSPGGYYLVTNIVYTPSHYDPEADSGSGFDENFLNVIASQTSLTNTMVDGSIVDATNFIAIGTSGYYGTQIPVTNGVHTISSSQPVEVQVYGWGYEDAYGYFGGVVK